MAIEDEHGVLVTDVLVLAPDVPAGMEFLWDNNCLKYLKKHWAEISSYYKRERLSVRNTEICTCKHRFQYSHK